MDGYLKLFGNCFITNGAARSLIYDAQRKTYYLVPHSLVHFLEQASGKRYTTVVAGYPAADRPFLDEYLAFLLEHEIIFFCSTEEEWNRFPPTDTHWEYPAIITNAVIEAATPERIIQFNEARGDLFIPYVQLSVAAPVRQPADLELLVTMIAAKPVKGIQLLFNNEAGFSEATLIELCNKMKIIETLVAFNSSSEQLIRSETTHLHFTRQANFDKHSCGIVSPEYFNTEWQHYTESLKYNTCLNRKIAIDESGNIKNCPAMPRNFGHISTTPLLAVVNNTGFTEMWHIKKDQIGVCKDCEFRHICTDCRAYLETPEDPYSQPLKCGYNPYTCEWLNWSENPLKEKAAAYYKIPL